MTTGHFLKFPSTLHPAIRISTELAFIFWAAVLTGRALWADDLQMLWQLAPGDRPYLTTGNTERGLAFNPATTNLVLVSRAGGLNVQVLDAATGADVRALDVTGISGDTFPLDMVGVADDGAVYAGNLSTSATAPNFKLYRWANDSADTVPTVAFQGDPAGLDANGASKNPQRWGDSLDVRGSGTNTMVVIASRASPAVAVFTTTDGTNFTATLITGAAAGAGSLGVAFGEGNTLWTKSIDVPLRHVSFDLAAGQATLLNQFADPAIPNGVSTVAVQTEKKILAGISSPTPGALLVYDISSATDLVLISQKNFPTSNANANNTGSADFGMVNGTNVVFGLDSNNGIVAYRFVPTPAAPPSIVTQPQSQTVLAGAQVSFSVTASGSGPFQYQWQFNGTNISRATNSTLTLASLQPKDSGTYRVIVSNSSGSVTSADAILTVNPLVSSGILRSAWRIAPGARSYINTDNSQRGLAYNPKTGNVLLISRTDGPKIYVLNGKTSEDLGQLNTDPSIVFGGTFSLNMIGVADDGAVYACNLVTNSSTADFVIYRWADDSASATPTVAFIGDPSKGDSNADNRRFGDSFDVRGAGANTQFLAGSRNGKLAVVFTTANGNDFTPVSILTDAAAGDFGLSVAFGTGNSFWGKAATRPLRLFDFDVKTGQGTTRTLIDTSAVPGSVSPIGVDMSHNFLAGLAIETPHNIRLYDISALPATPTLVDQKLIGTDNPNINETGSVRFGGGYLYVLDSNNAVVGYTVNVATGPKSPTLSAPKRLGNGDFQFKISGTPGASYAGQASADLRAWATLQTVTIDSSGSSVVTDASAAGLSHRFYRATAK